MQSADILGRWDIVEWVQRYDDGRQVYPMGRALEGFIHYDHDYMFVVIARVGRPPIVASQWTASDEAKAEAYGGYFTYAGGYAIDGDEIVHRVQFSLFPNWVGSEQRRRVALKDGALHLTARMEESTTEARTAELIWRRQAPESRIGRESRWNDRGPS